MKECPKWIGLKVRLCRDDLINQAAFKAPPGGNDD